MSVAAPAPPSWRTTESETVAGSPLKIGSLGELQSLLGKPQLPSNGLLAVHGVRRGRYAAPARRIVFSRGPSGKRYAGSVIEVSAFDDTYHERTR